MLQAADAWSVGYGNRGSVPDQRGESVATGECYRELHHAMEVTLPIVLNPDSKRTFLKVKRDLMVLVVAHDSSELVELEDRGHEWDSPQTDLSSGYCG